MKPVFKIIVLLAVILAGGFLFKTFFEKDVSEIAGYVISRHTSEEENDLTETARSGVKMINGRLAVHLPETVQQQADIKLEKLEQAEYRKELHAVALVIDIQPLVKLRSDIREIQTGIKMAETALQVSSREYERLKLLHEEASNISDKDLQQSKLQWMSDELELQGKRNRFDDLKDESIQTWGSELTEQIINNSDIVQRLIERKLLLLLVTIENNQPLPEGADTATISQHGRPEFTGEAYFLARALHVDSKTLGQTYLFYTPAVSLRTGQYIDAWITADNNLQQGVYIPPQAVIWYVDKPWVYQKTGKHSFVRKEVKDFAVTRQGWFVRNEFQGGDEIVIQGAQMLLSEEFRWSIPDEDDNP